MEGKGKRKMICERHVTVGWRRKRNRDEGRFSGKTFRHTAAPGPNP